MKCWLRTLNGFIRISTFITFFALFKFSSWTTALFMGYESHIGCLLLACLACGQDDNAERQFESLNKFYSLSMLWLVFLQPPAQNHESSKLASAL